jgi:phage-related protein
MQWTIHYYNQSVKEDTRVLPKSIKAKFEAIMDKMIEHGPDIGLPFTKAMGKGLFEIRAKAQEGIARGMFCTISGNTIVILHVFLKKTQATPKKELDLAIKRMKEVKNHDI